MSKVGGVGGGGPKPPKTSKFADKQQNSPTKSLTTGFTRISSKIPLLLSEM